MKLSIERAALLRAVSQAQSVVERRNTIPILANVLIEAEGDTASFRATDLDIEVVDRIPAKVERAGATTVSAVTLHEIVRKLPDGALVNITEDTAAGPPDGGGRTLHLPARDAAEGRFPGDGRVGLRREFRRPRAHAAPALRQV
jgi:hypothetical protein